MQETLLLQSLFIQALWAGQKERGPKAKSTGCAPSWLAGAKVAESISTILDYSITHVFESLLLNEDL